MKISVISTDDKGLLSTFMMEGNTIFQLEVRENI